MLNEVLKICKKMTYADVKPNVKQLEIKELVTISYKFFRFATEIKRKAGIYFLFDFGCYSIQLDFAH